MVGVLVGVLVKLTVSQHSSDSMVSSRSGSYALPTFILLVI